MTEKYFKKIDLGVSGHGLLMYPFGEIRNPITILLPDDIERLIDEWEK